MAQYNVKQKQYRKSGDTLFEVMMLATENGLVSVNNPLPTSGGSSVPAAGQNPGKVLLGQVSSRSKSIHQNFDSTESQVIAVIGIKLGSNVITRASLQWTEIQ